MEMDLYYLFQLKLLFNLTYLFCYKHFGSTMNVQPLVTFLFFFCWTSLEIAPLLLTQPLIGSDKL